MQVKANVEHRFKKVEKELFEKYKDVNLDVKPNKLEQRGGAYYSDAACNLISSLATMIKEIFKLWIH